MIKLCKRANERRAETLVGGKNLHRGTLVIVSEKNGKQMLYARSLQVAGHVPLDYSTLRFVWIFNLRDGIPPTLTVKCVSKRRRMNWFLYPLEREV